MEKLAELLVAGMLRRQTIKEEERAIFLYGIQVGLEVILNTIVSILIAVACHMELETLTFFAVFIPMRAYAGGVHLEKYISCMICSCLSLFGLLMIVKYTFCGEAATIIITVVSLLFIMLLAPVEDKNRMLDEDEKRLFQKKLVIAEICILVALIIFYMLKLYRMMSMVMVTCTFMVCVLVVGKVKFWGRRDGYFSV